MKRDSRLCLGTVLIALVVSATAPAVAQEVAPPPTPNADRLAEEMRTLARDPRNVRALLSAGEMSARLNDPAAAAGFFARAQSLDPANPRVLAGQAMVMVRQERPGEALRLFAEAERRGLAMESYASDLGLAYDLVGAQAHAQREHRIAMRGNPDDETLRRYALSLGISGQESEAMRVLDPLLRRSDRAGWRARAFILAMNGDAPGADKIAASMMGGAGSALAPFFRRLPTLSASDKAFAVHFGELRRTTARIADAQLAPQLPRLGHEPGVAVASVELPRREPQVAPRPADRRSAASRRSGERLPLGWRANEEAEARRTAARQAEEREAKRLADLKAQQEREALATKQRDAERIAAEQSAAREAEVRRVAEQQARERATQEFAAREVEARRVAEAQRLADAQRAAEARQLADAQRLAASQPAPAPVTEPEAVASVATSEPAPTDAPPPAVDPVRTAAAPQVGSEDNVIARIIAGITIPASELGVEPMPGRPEAAPVAQPAPVPTPPVEVAKAETPKPRPVVETPKPETAKPKPEPAKPKPEPAKPKPEVAKPEPGKPGTRGKPVDPKAVDPKAAKPGDPKGASAKGAAAKPPAKGKGKPEPVKPDPAKSDPARHWVQVAGGANVSDLPKAWRALLAKAPAELRARQTWTTPLRFTNRLLVGPFKTSAEAQAFVNTIGKKGISAFAWSSDAGQKIEKLAVK